MKDHARRIVSLFLTVQLALSGPAGAAVSILATAPPNTVPTGVNYQGRLEENGFPVSGSRSMIFRLFNVASGGTALYTETLAVPVSKGVFNAPLSIPVSALMGSTQKYLEIQVETDILAPREPFRSVPYAMIAKTVEGSLEISSGGLYISTSPTASQPALQVSTETATAGFVSINTARPAARLHLSSGTFLVDGDAGVPIRVGVSSFVFTANGDLGIGLTNPSGRLHIVGGDVFIGNHAIHDDTPNVEDLFVAGNVIVDGRIVQHLGTINQAVDFNIQGQVTIISSTTVQGALGVGAQGLGNGTLVVKSTSATPANPIASLLTFTDLEVMRVQQDGNAGIGTSAPGARLDVRSDSSSTAVEGNRVLVLRNNNTATDNRADVEFFTPTTGGADLGGAMISALFSLRGPSSVQGELAFYTRLLGGALSERLRIDENGSVGIGNSSPLVALHVNGAGRFGDATNTSNPTTAITPGLRIGLIGADEDAGLEFYSRTAGSGFGWLINAPDRNAAFAGDIPLAIKFRNSSASWTELVTMRSDFFGMVGIGSTFPAGKLTVGGSVTFPSKLVWQNFDAAAGLKHWASFLDAASNFNLAQLDDNAIVTTTHLYMTRGGLMGIGTTNTSDRLTLEASGTNRVRYLEGGVDRASVGVSAAGGIFTGITDNWLGIRSESGNGIVLGVGNSMDLTVESGGNVGIGTTDPAQKLHVSGGGVRVSTATAEGDLALFIDPASGNVAVGGMATPTVKLLVNGKSGSIQIDPDAPALSSLKLLGTFASSTADGARIRIGNTTASIDLGQNTASDFAVEAPAGSERLTIKRSNGGVGIGQTSPTTGTLLQVGIGGYLQAEKDLNGTVTAADCDQLAEAGRITFDSSTSKLYVCMGSGGWKNVALAP